MPPTTWAVVAEAGPPEQAASRAGPLVVVTRPQPQADDWVARLAARGVAAQALPLLGIADAADPATVPAAWAGLASQNLVMFVSPSAVERFFDQAGPRPAAGTAEAVWPVWPAGVLAGSTGPGTQAALLRRGVPAAAIVSPAEKAARFDSEALWHRLRGLQRWQGMQVLIVRGEGGRNWLADTLRQHGAQVHFVEAYRRTAPVLDTAGQGLLLRALAQPQAHLWLFSSSEAVQQLPVLATAADWSRSRAWATHARIAQAARDIGFGTVEEVPATVEAVAARITPSIQSAPP